MQIPGTQTDGDAPILARAAAWQPHVSLDELNAEFLCELAAQYDLDFATAVLYDRLTASSRFAATRAMLERLDSFDFDEVTRPSLIAVVPGAFYRESPQTGADGDDIRLAAAKLGIPCEVIPLRSFGNLTENSQIIREWLASRRETSIVLVSLSKGGAEVKHGLAQAPAAFDGVTAWINLSGILERSPLAEWLLNQRLRSLVIRLWFWWRGYDFNVVHEYATRANHRVVHTATHAGHPRRWFSARDITCRRHSPSVGVAGSPRWAPTTRRGTCWPKPSDAPASSCRSGAPTITCVPPVWILCNLFISCSRWPVARHPPSTQTLLSPELLDESSIAAARGRDPPQQDRHLQAFAAICSAHADDAGRPAAGRSGHRADDSR